MNPLFFGAKPNRHASRRQGISAAKKNMGIKQSAIPDAVKKALASLPPLEVRQAEEQAEQRRKEAEQAAAKAEQAAQQRQERTQQDIAQLEASVKRGTQLQSVEVRRLFGYQASFPEHAPERERIGQILQTNARQTAMQTITAFRNRVEQGDPLQAKEIQQLQESRTLFAEDEPTQQLIDQVLRGQEKASATRFVRTLQGKVAQQKPLSAEEVKTLAQWQQIGQDKPESPQGQLQELIGMILDTNLVVSIQAQPQPLTEEQATALQQVIQKPWITDEQRQVSQRLINALTLKKIEAQFSKGSVESLPATLQTLVQFSEDPKSLTRNQRDKLGMLFTQALQHLYPAGEPVNYGDYTAFEQRLQPVLAAIPQEQASSVERHLMLAWGRNHLEAALQMPEHSRPLRGLHRISQVLAPTHSLVLQAQQLIGDAIVPKLIQNALMGNLPLAPGELKQLASLNPHGQLPGRKNEILMLVRSHLEALQSQALRKIHDTMEYHDGNSLAAIVQQYRDAKSQPDLVRLMESYQLDDLAQNNSDTLNKRVKLFNDLVFMEGPGFFYQGVPREGAPLESVRLLTYNLKEMSVPEDFDREVEINEALAELANTKGKLSTEELQSARSRLEQSKISAHTNREKRLHQLAKRLLQADADVVVLQEAEGIHNLMRFLETTGLKKLYPNVVYALPTVGSRTQAKAMANGFIVPGVAVLTKKNVGVDLTQIRTLGGSQGHRSSGARPLLEMSLDIGQQKPMKLQAVHLKADNNRPDAINHNFADVRQRELAVLSERVDKLPDYAWVTIGDFNEAGISVPNMQELVPSNASVGTYLNNANRGSSRLDKAFGHNVILEHAEILTCDDEPSDHRPVLVTVRPQPKNWR